jgi:hypothetical protein
MSDHDRKVVNGRLRKKAFFLDFLKQITHRLKRLVCNLFYVLTLRTANNDTNG